MGLTPSNCITSDMLKSGDSAWTDACVIDVVEVLDTNRVIVKVYPLHEGRIDITMYQGQTYNFIDFQVPFQITPKSVFYGSTTQAANFIICDLIEPPEPTLYISDINANTDPIGDRPEYNRYGVAAQVTIKGAGVGHLKLSWGTDHDVTTMDVTAGNYGYRYNLPPGTHNVCADLFNIELQR